MTDWYRNTHWSEDIAEAFERRLARSRGQKAQYLCLQGHALIAGNPGIACELLERAIALDDEFQTPRALAFLAIARLALGHIDLALDAYEAALERQIAQPDIVAVQAADYVFVVGLFSRADRLHLVEPIADALQDEGIFGRDPQVSAAKALVYALAGRGGDARHQAEMALELMADMPDVAALGIDIGDLRQRLEVIAGQIG